MGKSTIKTETGGLIVEDCEILNAIDDYLQELPHTVLVRIGASMLGSELEWNDEIPLKPCEWEVMTEKRKFEFLNCIRHDIELIVGEKAVLRYYYTVKKGFTEQQFEDKWDSRVKRELECDHKTLRDDYARGIYKNDDRHTLIAALVGILLGNFIVMLLGLII